MKRVLVALGLVAVIGSTAARTNGSDLIGLRQRVERVEAQVIELCKVTYGAEHPATTEGPVSPELLACLELFVPSA